MVKILQQSPASPGNRTSWALLQDLYHDTRVGGLLQFVLQLLRSTSSSSATATWFHQELPTTGEDATRRIVWSSCRGRSAGGGAASWSCSRTCRALCGRNQTI